MIRQYLPRTSTQLTRCTRSFTVSTRVMAEGDLGAPKSGGQRDAYSDRTKAEEDQYVRQQELQKLKALREKLTAQRTSIGDLINNIDEMTKEQGGEESQQKK